MIKPISNNHTMTNRYDGQHTEKSLLFNILVGCKYNTIDVRALYKSVVAMKIYQFERHQSIVSQIDRQIAEDEKASKRRGSKKSRLIPLKYILFL